MKTATMNCLGQAAKAPFQLPAHYQSLNATAKQRLLQEQVSQSAYEVGNLPPMKTRGVLKAALSLAMPFKKDGDVRPAKLQGHTKIFHPFGVEGAGTFRPEPNSPATGLFQGAQTFIRLSLATPSGFAPGLAVKFLVDGALSENIFALYSLDGQGDNHNFMANDFSNRTPVPKGKALQLGGLILSLIKSDPYSLPVEHVAYVNSNGTRVENPNAPKRLVFRATELSAKLFAGTETSSQDFRYDLMTRIQGEMPLFDVFAEFEGSRDLVKIGALWTGVDGLKASRFGEEGLLFRHRR